MSENAISYFKGIFERYPRYESKTVSHIRITDNNFNDPQNIVIDYPSRDIAEYLKYILFSNSKFTCSKNSIKNIFNLLFFIYSQIISNLYIFIVCLF